MAKLGKEAI